MDGEWTEEGATAHIMALATAAPQDERVDATSGPAPTDTDILHALVSCNDSARLVGGLIRDDADFGEVRRRIVGVVRYALERFAAPQDAPEPEGLREARRYRAALTTAANMLDDSKRPARAEIARELRLCVRALARPAAAEGVEGKAASIARAALDKMDREPPTNEFITACAALRRIAALASDDGEGQA
jgi:hypothetical protein